MRKIDRKLSNTVEQDKFRRVRKSHEDNINAKDNKEFYTPLHNAARDGDLEAIKYSVNKGDDINGYSCGYTPLHVAAMYGHLEAVRSLIGKGANVHVRNAIFGDKPIQSATVGGHKNIVGFFLNKEGISINDADNGGRTLLHYAADCGQLEIVRLLTDKGANIYAKDNNGLIPSGLARGRGYMRVVDILGGTKKKSRLLETTSDNLELYLSGVTVKKQPMRTRAPGN
ncbi:MAG: ankyrin repeat domain-containing protein [Wolbachia sp.]